MENANQEFDTKDVKVLIVEDDKFLQKILITKFLADGFDVCSAADGEEALAVFQKEKPSLVLLDLILPKMSGFEVLTEMKLSSKSKKIPVIVISNLGQQEDIFRVKELGAIDFLIKADWSINAMVKKVKELYTMYLQHGDNNK